jgi:hypothetical protein
MRTNGDSMKVGQYGDRRRWHNGHERQNGTTARRKWHNDKQWLKRVSTVTETTAQWPQETKQHNGNKRQSGTMATRDKAA